MYSFKRKYGNTNKKVQKKFLTQKASVRAMSKSPDHEHTPHCGQKWKMHALK